MLITFQRRVSFEYLFLTQKSQIEPCNPRRSRFIIANCILHICWIVFLHAQLSCCALTEKLCVDSKGTNWTISPLICSKLHSSTVDFRVTLQFQSRKLWETMGPVKQSFTKDSSRMRSWVNGRLHSVQVTTLVHWSGKRTDCSLNECGSVGSLHYIQWIHTNKHLHITAYE